MLELSEDVLADALLSELRFDICSNVVDDGTVYCICYDVLDETWSGSDG